MNIESGNFYKTKCGAKAKVIEVIATRCVAIGYILTQGGSIVSHDWKADTGENRNNDYLMDLVSPWFDPPVVVWGNFPKHIVAVAMSEYGSWCGFMEAPVCTEGANGHLGSWSVGKPYHAFDIHDDEEPIFYGDWHDSLAIRPAYADAEPPIPFPPCNSDEPTPGPWSIGNGSCVVADHPTGHDDPETIKSYGGHLVCESATKGNLHLIAAAWEMYEACKEAHETLSKGFTPEEFDLVKSGLHNAICSAEGIPF